jgi:hypothetical protein
MAQVLQAHEIDCTGVKPFLPADAERVKAHAVALAASTASRSWARRRTCASTTNRRAAACTKAASKF